MALGRGTLALATLHSTTWLNVLFAPTLDFGDRGRAEGVWTCSTSGSVLQECHNDSTFSKKHLVFTIIVVSSVNMCVSHSSHLLTLRAAMDRWAGHGHSQKPLLLATTPYPIIANILMSVTWPLCQLRNPYFNLCYPCHLPISRAIPSHPITFHPCHPGGGSCQKPSSIWHPRTQKGPNKDRTPTMTYML